MIQWCFRMFQDKGAVSFQTTLELPTLEYGCKTCSLESCKCDRGSRRGMFPSARLFSQDMWDLNAFALAILCLSRKWQWSKKYCTAPLVATTFFATFEPCETYWIYILPIYPRILLLWYYVYIKGLWHFHFFKKNYYIVVILCMFCLLLLFYAFSW